MLMMCCYAVMLCRFGQLWESFLLVMIVIYIVVHVVNSYFQQTCLWFLEMVSLSWIQVWRLNQRNFGDRVVRLLFNLVWKGFIENNLNML